MNELRLLQLNRHLILILLPIPVFGFCQNSEMTWKAGTANINITPKQSMWISGYASRNHPSEGVRHDVWVKALALEDQKGQRGVMVSMDLTLLFKQMSDRIREKIKRQYGLDKEQIILNVSHTYSGPATNSED